MKLMMENKKIDPILKFKNLPIIKVDNPVKIAIKAGIIIIANGIKNLKLSSKVNE